ncbi:hypothetical protein [Acidovorax sp.]|jgi:hypothetical protein
MSAPHTPHNPESSSDDPTESVAHLAPVVLPVVGGIMIFLLAFIAVYMA